jgi:hypothetical protein
MAGTPRNALESAKPYALAIALFVAGAAIVGVGAGLGFSVDDEASPGFSLELAKAMVTLGSGLILGGAVKVLLDRYQEAQKDRAEDHELRERLLADLRGVHDRTESARLMVKAHRSAKTYGEQMRDLIGCQVVLLKVKRTLDLRPGSTRDLDPEGDCLEEMAGYLRALQNEYARNYKCVADCQRYDENLTQLRFKAIAERQIISPDMPFDTDALSPSQHAWDLMRDPKLFPVLDDLSRRGERYTTRFVGPLHVLAAQLLRTDTAKLDTEFDARVDERAKKIQSICEVAVETVERHPGNETPAAASRS